METKRTSHVQYTYNCLLIFHGINDSLIESLNHLNFILFQEPFIIRDTFLCKISLFSTRKKPSKKPIFKPNSKHIKSPGLHNKK